MRRPPTVPPPDSIEKLAFLRNPSSYPHAPSRVDVIETHYAWVFLAGEFTYKLKKPLRQDSMDYRTLAARAKGCRAELRLNRRLARRVYLDVIPLSRSRTGRLVLGRGREVVDWLVWMQTLPAERMLDTAIRSGTAGPRDLSRLVEVLAAFFAGTTRKGMTARAYEGRLRERIRRNQQELLAPDLGLDQRRVEPVIETQTEFLTRARDIMAERAACLRDGHGDLRPEHVWIGRPVCVIDCLEFDADLRRLDPAEEIAFLALECTRLGDAALASALLRRYRVASRERIPDALFDFYMSQRAATRAKIAAWHLRDPQFVDRSRWVRRANSYLADALRYARLALAGADAGPAISGVRGQRPIPQQRRKRRADKHPADRGADERRDRQHGQPATLR